MGPKRGPPRGQRATRGRNARRRRGERVHDEASHLNERPGGEGERREEEVEQPEPQLAPAQVAAIMAALAAQNLLRVTPTVVGSEARGAMKEFRHMKPPIFDGENSDPLKANHWLSEIRKLFNASAINDDTVRVNLVACQLTGEANEWWESVLAARRDARRAARTAQQVNEPDVENLTWGEFETLFEGQYFPDSYKEQLRDQFEKLERGNMTISEYATKYQTLSRFAPELVSTEERKCRRFEKGLEGTLKQLVMTARINRFSEMVEFARNLESAGEVARGPQREEARPIATTVSAPPNFYGSQGRKRQREQFQPSQSQGSFRAPSSSGFRGGSSRPPMVCHNCKQPGHMRAQCPYHSGSQPQSTSFPGSCFTCGKTGHLARDCTRGRGARSQSGSVQQSRGGYSVSQPRVSHGQS